MIGGFTQRRAAGHLDQKLRGIYTNRASGQIGLELVVQTMVPLNDVQKISFGKTTMQSRS